MREVIQFQVSKDYQSVHIYVYILHHTQNPLIVQLNPWIPARIMDP